MKLNLKIGRFLHILRKINHPGLIMSVPGLGKTSTIEMYCKAYDLNLTTLIASQYAADDILGIQVNDGGKLKRLAPNWFDDLIDRSKNGKPNILFIDELTTCDEFIQAPLLNLIFSKSLGVHKLPENTYILAAGNYEDCLNKAFSMTAPLVNRFLILNIYPSDVDLNELVEDKFRNIKSKSEMLRFLGLNNLPEDPIEVNKEIQLNIKSLFTTSIKFNCEIKNSMDTGLVGFSSMRSIQYSLDYVLASLAYKMTGTDLIEIICDTLGAQENFKSNFIRILQNIDISDSIRRSTAQSSDIKGLDERELEALVRKLINEPYTVTEKQFQEISKRQKELPGSLYKTFSDTVLNLG